MRDDGFEKLQPIAERIRDIESLVPRQILVIEYLTSRFDEVVAELLERLDAYGRVRLPGRAEVVLYAQVKLDRVRSEPDPASHCEGRRFRHFSETEQPAVEVSCDILLAGRHCQVNVMNREELHQESGNG